MTQNEGTTRGNGAAEPIIPSCLEKYAADPRWVVWTYEQRGDKKTKPPYDPCRVREPKKNYAKNDDPDSWGTLAEARSAFQRLPWLEGYGFEFDGNGLGEVSAFDLDNCRKPQTSELHPWVQRLLERCNSYAEVTPSNTGIRIFGLTNRRGTGKGRKQRVDDDFNGSGDPKKACSCESFRATNRYATITGRHIPGTPLTLANLDDVMDAVIAELDEINRSRGGGAGSGASSGDGSSSLPRRLLDKLRFPDLGESVPHGDRESRSSYLFAFLLEALCAGVNDATIIAACLHEQYRGCAIYAHCLGEGGRAYVERQLKKANEKIRESRQSELMTDLGNAKRFVRLCGENIRYVHQWRRWMTWSDGRWTRDDDGAATRLAKTMIEDMFAEASRVSDEAQRRALRLHALRSESAQRLGAMIKLAETEAPVVASAEKLDADPLLLGVTNGVIDLRAVTWREARRDDYVTKAAGVTFNADAKCPNWLAFLDIIFPVTEERSQSEQKKLIAYLQRVTGYLLTGLTVEEVMFVLWGKGNNGKSTFRETVFAMMGDYAVGSDAGLLLVNKNTGGATPDLARLHGRRLVTINETPQHSHLNETRVKFITGHDIITARNLYQEPFDFAPTHKTFLTTNNKPVVRDTDEGIWRRLHLVPFTTTIPENQRDRHFRAKKLLPEMSGILNWALEGLRSYHRDGLAPPKEVTAATQEYREDMDIVGRWIEERCHKDPTAEAKISELHNDYEEWAKEEVGFALSAIAFGRELSGREGLVRKKVEGVRGLCGLKLLPPM
jgi:putative DNA primase/helicase